MARRAVAVAVAVARAGAAPSRRSRSAAPPVCPDGVLETRSRRRRWSSRRRAAPTWPAGHVLHSRDGNAGPRDDHWAAERLHAEPGVPRPGHSSCTRSGTPATEESISGDGHGDRRHAPERAPRPLVTVPANVATAIDLPCKDGDEDSWTSSSARRPTGRPRSPTEGSSTHRRPATPGPTRSSSTRRTSSTRSDDATRDRHGRPRRRAPDHRRSSRRRRRRTSTAPAVTLKNASKKQAVAITLTTNENASGDAHGRARQGDGEEAQARAERWARSRRRSRRDVDARRSSFVEGAPRREEAQAVKLTADRGGHRHGGQPDDEDLEVTLKK